MHFTSGLKLQEEASEFFFPDLMTCMRSKATATHRLAAGIVSCMDCA